LNEPSLFHKAKRYLPYALSMLIAMPFVWWLFQPAPVFQVYLHPAGCVAAESAGLSVQTMENGICSIVGKRDGRLLSISVDGISFNRDVIVAERVVD